MIFMAVMLSALLACVLLVLDIGNLYAAQRNLEQQATLAALAGAQSLCMTTVTPAGEVSNSITENTLKSHAAPTLGSGGPLTGYIDSSSGTQVFSTGTKPLNIPGAVQVNLSSASPPGLASSLASRKSITMNASAAASERLFGKYTIGTGLGSLAGIPLGVPTIIPGFVPVTVPLVNSVGAFVTVREPPTTSGTGASGFVAPTSDTKSADVVIMLRLNVGATIGTLAAASIPLGIDIAIPASDAMLTEISCPSSKDPTAYTAIVEASTALATVTVGTYSGSPTAIPVAALSSVPGATVASVSLAGLPVVTLTQVSAPGPLTVDGSTSPTPMAFDVFENEDASNASEAATCSDEIYGTPPNADVCYIATPGMNTHTVFVGDSNVLASTINSALNSFLVSLKPNVLPGILPALLPVSVTAIPDDLASTLTGPTTSIGASVDTLIGPVLTGLGTTLGATVVTFQAVEHGSPISNTFTTVASGS